MNRTARTLALAGAATVGAALLAGPASAHISPDKDEVPAGGYTDVTLTVPHGCEESPTTQLEIQVPEALNDVTPSINPGWDVNVTTEPLAEPVDDGEGGQLTERESVVTYTAQSGNELADGFRTSFTLGFKAPETEGEYLFFKTIQTCAEGETAWIEEYTGEGEEPEHPAPVVLIGEAEGDGHGDDAAAEEEPAEAEEVTDGETADADTAAAQAPADDSDDDSDSNALAIAGLVAGLAGLGLGGVAFARTRSRA